MIKKDKNDLEKLKMNFNQKDIKIRENDILIKSLEDDDDDNEEEDDDYYSTEESDNEATSINARDNTRKMNSAGHFSKTFEARRGMEEEAEFMRREWRRNLKI